MVDPDGGVNVQKKRLKLGLIQEVNPTCNAEFPADGFQVGISCVPRIGYNHIWKYLIEDVEFKKQLSVEKPIVKGYNFFKSGKVLGLYSKSENGLVYVKSQVQPSYSKGGSVYAVKIIIHANSEIQKAFCPCPAGDDGRCNHLAASLFAMEDIFNKTVNMKETDTDQLPCTSKPCTWNVPKKRRQEPSTIQGVNFQKHVYGKESKAPRAPTPPVAVSQSVNDFESIFEKIKNTETKTRKKIGLSYIIPHTLPEKELLPPSEPECSNRTPAKWEVVSPVKDAPLSMSDIEQKALRAKQVQTNAMKDGIESESSIIQTFEHETGNKVLKSGFFISDTHPFLGASPDGLVDEDKIVEVKKIVLKEGESLEDGMCRLGIYKRFEQQLVLNNNHKYYYQIQQQLFCAKRSICYFIVSSARGTHRDTVQFDSAFWENILPRLESFYFDHVFPELVYPRILTGESRWNKDLQFPRLA